MKKRLLIILILFTVSSGEVFPALHVGFVGGLSTPNERVNDVYNRSRLFYGEETFSEITREAVGIGYHIGIRGRMPLSDDLNFIAGIEYHRFPESELRLSDTAQPSDPEYAVYSTRPNVLSFLAGLDYYLFYSLLDVYLCGDLQYNYLSGPVEHFRNDHMKLPELNPTYSRVGFGLGAGADLNIDLLKINIEMKYNVANMIGKTGDENTKGYFCLSFGVFFE